jgi:hypothetical protein
MASAIPRMRRASSHRLHQGWTSVRNTATTAYRCLIRQASKPPREAACLNSHMTAPSANDMRRAAHERSSVSRTKQAMHDGWTTWPLIGSIPSMSDADHGTNSPRSRLASTAAPPTSARAASIDFWHIRSPIGHQHVGPGTESGATLDFICTASGLSPTGLGPHRTCLSRHGLCNVSVRPKPRRHSMSR